MLDMEVGQIYGSSAMIGILLGMRTFDTNSEFIVALVEIAMFGNSLIVVFSSGTSVLISEVFQKDILIPFLRRVPDLVGRPGMTVFLAARFL